jgi:hypothetical protein
MTKEIAKRIIAGESDRDLAEDWDIMLNLADKELIHEDITSQLPEEPIDISSKGKEQIVFDRHRNLAHKPRTVITSCGVSAGLGEYETEAAVPTLLTGTFTVQGEASGKERTLKCKNCPLCLAPDIVATIANGKITCPKCNKSAPYDC